MAFLQRLVKKVASGGTLSLIAAFAVKGSAAAMSFLLSWLVAQRFGAAGVGHFSVALSTVVFIGTLTLFGFDYIATREVAVSLSRYEKGMARATILKIFRQVLIISSICAFVLAIGSRYLSQAVFEQSAIWPHLLILALAMPCMAMTWLASAIMRGMGSVVLSQVVHGLSGTGMAAFALALVIMSGMSIPEWTPALLYSIFWALTAFIVYLYIFQQMKSWPRDGSKSDMHFLQGTPVLVAGISNLLLDWLVGVVLIRYGGAESAGVFRAAYQFVTVLVLVASTLENTISPAIASAISQKRMDLAKKAQSHALKAAFVVVVPYCLIMLFFATPILSLFGPKFVEGRDALLIMMLGYIVHLALSGAGAFINMSKQLYLWYYYAIGSIIVTLVSCFILVPTYGLVGAAWAITVTLIVRRVILLLLIRFGLKLG